MRAFLKFKNFKDKKTGFTLVELLVVIAIIGLLSSVVYASVSSARARALTAKKQTELNQLMKAVETYYSTTLTMPANTTPGTWCYVGTGACLDELVAAGYYTALPRPDSSSYYYYYDYGTFGLVAVYMNPQQYGPGPNGWCCSQATCSGATSPKLYCLNFDK